MEQFALAMYLIAEKVRKKDIPDELTPAMVPPSLRGKVPPLSATPLSTSSVSTTVSSASTWGGVMFPTAVSSTTSTSVTWTTPTSSSSTVSDGAGFGSDFSAIQELDSITHEIDSIRK